MSVKVLVYAPQLSNEYLPLISARFAEQNMRVQFPSGFDLGAVKNAAVVKVRMFVDSREQSRYPQVEMNSEMELSAREFRYSSPVSVNPSMNEKLKPCTRVLTIRMHATHASAFRLGMYFAAFLAQVADGIVYAPRSDDYMDASRALAQFAEEVRLYEAELPPQDWHVTPAGG